MSYAIDPLTYTQFKGIREYNGVNSGEQISAITCQNVELVQTELGSNTGIKNASGNNIKYSLPTGYTTIQSFESKQDNITHILIYGETDEKGTLFYIDLLDNLNVLVDDLTVTGECNGITISSTAYDVFVFTNGVEMKTVCFTIEQAYADVIINNNPVEFPEGYIADINAVDYLGREVKGLSICNWNGYLVIATDHGVNASHQNDIYTWNEDPQDVADAWYVDFTKKVTAVYGFTGGLYIFTDDDCTLLTASPNDKSSSMKTSAGVGCYSYSSIVKHDLYLFFYDNRQKNIYYLSATDTTGQIRPNGPVAKEVQSYFTDVSRFKLCSCVYNTKNEIWCLINDDLLIFNFNRQEWTTRKEQKINNVALINNSVYTAGVNGVIYIEDVNDNFSGVYFPSIYQTTFINAGSNTNIKKQKTALLLTLNTYHINKFFVQLTINNKAKNPKKVFLNKILTGIYANENGSSTDTRTKFGTAQYSPENTYKKSVVEISTPQTWYTMGIKIYTEEKGQGFFITSMELKNMKVKTKTKGR